MRKFAIFFLLVITACSTTAPESVSPEMTVTPVDTPTPGVTPDIAATAVVMATEVAESAIFDAIQQRVAEESEWTLGPDGTLSRTSDEGLVTVTGLAIDRESGKCTYTGGDEPMECDPDSLVFGADGSITLTLADGTVIVTKDGESWKPVVEYVDINAMTADPYNFTPEQMTGFEKIGKTTITLNGHDVPALVGVSGEEQTVLAMEVTNFNGERVMARVSVTTDPETGVQYGVFVNPDFDAGDTEGQGDNTGRVMMALGEDGAQEIFFGKYGVFSRFGPAAPNGGKYGPIGPLGLRQLVAKSLGVGIEMDTLTQLDNPTPDDKFAMEWEKLPRKVDWGLPLELVFAMDEAGYANLPEEVKREMVTVRDPNNPFGSLFWVGEDGHPIMYVVDRVFFANGGKSKDLEFQEKATQGYTGYRIFKITWMLGRERDEQRSGYASSDSGSINRDLKPLSEKAFEFNIK